MPKDDLVYLGHMLDMARKALTITHGRNRESYDRDDALRLALAYLTHLTHLHLLIEMI